MSPTPAAMHTMTDDLLARYQQECIACLVHLGKLRDANDVLLAALQKVQQVAGPEGDQKHADHVRLFTIAHIAAAALAAAAPEAARGHDDCCLSETDNCNWPKCSCDGPQPVAADHPNDTHS